MTYENKIAIIIRDDLQTWQKFNAASFSANPVAIQFPETRGAKFVNASGSEYLPFIKHPIPIYKADTQLDIKRAFLRARFSDEEQIFAGSVIHGGSKKVNKALEGSKFHA